MVVRRKTLFRMLALVIIVDLIRVRRGRHDRQRHGRPGPRCEREAMAGMGQWRYHWRMYIQLTPGSSRRRDVPGQKLMREEARRAARSKPNTPSYLREIPSPRGQLPLSWCVLKSCIYVHEYGTARAPVGSLCAAPSPRNSKPGKYIYIYARPVRYMYTERRVCGSARCFLPQPSSRRRPPHPRSSILDPRSSILDPRRPLSLVLLAFDRPPPAVPVCPCARAARQEGARV